MQKQFYTYGSEPTMYERKPRMTEPYGEEQYIVEKYIVGVSIWIQLETITIKECHED